MKQGSGSQTIQKVRTFAMDASFAQTNPSTVVSHPKEGAPVAVPKKPESIIPKKPVPQKEVSPNIPPQIVKPIQTAPATIHTKPLPQQATAVVPKKEIVRQHSAPVVPTPQNTQSVLPKKFMHLEDEVSTLNTHKAESILSDSSKGVDMGEGGGGGTIIRDTKRKRFKLIPALGQAVQDWINEQKALYTEYKHPHSEITTSDARKEVITAAVAQSARAPREDFAEVAKRKQQEERHAITSTLILKEKEALPKPSWSHVVASENTETNTAVETPKEGTTNPEPVVREVAHEQKPISPEAAVPQKEIQTHVTASPIPTKIAPKEEVPAVDLEQEPRTMDRKTIVPEVEPEQTQEAQTFARVQMPTIQRETIAQYTETHEEEEENSQQTIRSTAVAPRNETPRKSGRYNAQALSQYLLIGVVVLATIGGASLGVYLFGTQQEEAAQIVTTSYTIPQLIRVERQEGIPLQTDAEAFMQSLAQRVDETTGVAQFYPTIDTEQGPRPASVREIVDTLQFQAPGSLVRSIREMTFGAVSGEPFIILSTGSFDTAFAGMLEWEKSMSSHLTPLFGPTVYESFDPSARTDTQVRSAFFKDAIASNKNVRLLFDEKGEDRFVYTFVNQNTIVITTTREALQILLPLVP